MPPCTQSVDPEKEKIKYVFFVRMPICFFYFFNPHMNSNGCKLFSLGRRGERGNHDKLSFFQVIIILLCLCQIVPQTQQSASPAPPPPCRLFIPFGSNQHFCISQPFRGCYKETHCFQSFPTELLVVRSLDIFKNNAFHDRFNLNLSIIMKQWDGLNFHPGRNGSWFKPWCCFHTLVGNFAKKWTRDSFSFLFPWETNHHAS